MGKEYELTAEVMTVGRVATAQIVLADSFASRQHAEIYFVDNGYQIRDLGSKNGVYVRGERLGADERVWLNDGDELQFASTRFRFHDPSATVTAPALMAVREPGLRVEEATRQVFVDGVALDPPLSVKQFDLLAGGEDLLYEAFTLLADLLEASLQVFAAGAFATIGAESFPGSLRKRFQLRGQFFLLALAQAEFLGHDRVLQSIHAPELNRNAEQAIALVRKQHCIQLFRVLRGDFLARRLHFPIHLFTDLANLGGGFLVYFQITANRGVIDQIDGIIAAAETTWLEAARPLLRLRKANHAKNHAAT